MYLCVVYTKSCHNKPIQDTLYQPQTEVQSCSSRSEELFQNTSGWVKIGILFLFDWNENGYNLDIDKDYLILNLFVANNSELFLFFNQVFKLLIILCGCVIFEKILFRQLILQILYTNTIYKYLQILAK